ncbi:MAG: LacI family DNA-binding transcriptional regulator, partial [Deinococcus sp.]
YLHSLAERQVDGLLLLGGRANLVAPEAARLQDIIEIAERLPIVSINGDFPGVEGVYSVNSDERAGTEALLTHLLDAGHTKVAFLGGLEDVTGTQLKLGVYREMLAERGLKALPAWVQLSGYNVQAGEEALRRVLAQPEQPTAALCVNDLVAAGVLRAAAASGLAVPGDLSVTGFDDVDLAELVTPPLTSVDHNYQALAQLAVDVLLRAVESQQQPRLSAVPTFLVPRGSVARPGAVQSPTSGDQHVHTRSTPLRRRL